MLHPVAIALHCGTLSLRWGSGEYLTNHSLLYCPRYDAAGRWPLAPCCPQPEKEGNSVILNGDLNSANVKLCFNVNENNHI